MKHTFCTDETDVELPKLAVERYKLLMSLEGSLRGPSIKTISLHEQIDAESLHSLQGAALSRRAVDLYAALLQVIRVLSCSDRSS
jgi:hypothetical protein